MLVALLCEGHILIEDVPGIGKTTLAKAFARSLNITFKRIQFTPDLLPSDITGISYFNQKQQEFVFRPGPILANILLADEINRATPRTQAAMLEAMQEQQITVDGETRSLPRPFLVLATQNPVELEGTFPLPEAQLDRFLLRLKLGYPDDDEENRMLLRFEQDNPLAALQPVCQGGDVLQMIQGVRHIRVADNVRRYIVAICRTTRTHNTIELGVSPRGTMALYHASQALAALRGRDYVIPDDAKYLAPMVLTHRIILSPQIRLRGRNTETVIQEIVDSVPVPVEE
ncbi:MAG: MoxR family ATPase [Chloroflexi bacterium]|nr:MoxR family ATPase [Chloroflexota bacterium]